MTRYPKTTLLLLLFGILTSCVSNKKIWEVTASRTKYLRDAKDNCNYEKMKGIALGDEPGYIIDTAFINEHHLIISIKPGLYRFDPITGKDEAIKFQIDKISVYAANKKGERFVPKDSLAILRQNDQLVVPIRRARNSCFLVGADYEFGMFVTLIELTKKINTKSK